MTHRVERATFLDGPEFVALTRALVERARERVWVSQFVIDARPDEDWYGEVRYLLHALAAAKHRRVDVRVIVPSLMTHERPVYELNYPAVRFLTTRGVPVRYYRPTHTRRSMHAKAIVVDRDAVVVGNSNWSPSAFRLNEESSVAIVSAGVNRNAAGRFLTLWRRRGRDEDPPPGGSVVEEYKTGSNPSRGYWPPERDLHDPVRLYAEEAQDLYDRLRSYRPDSSQPWGTLLAGQAYMKAVVSLIASASERVWVSMNGLRASSASRLHPLLHALRAAADRGVEVRALYQHRAGTQTDWAADASVLQDWGIDARPWPIRSRLHSRCITVDGSHIVVGSVGWTPRSILLSEELSVHIHDPEVACQADARFDANWTNTINGRWNLDEGSSLPRFPPYVLRAVEKRKLDSAPAARSVTRGSGPPNAIEDLVPIRQALVDESVVLSNAEAEDE